MSNFLYNKAKEDFLGGDLDLVADTLRVLLVDTNDYTPSQAHLALSDIPAPARVVASDPMTSKSITGGIFDAQNVVFNEVTGDESEALVIYKDTGTASTSRLIAFIDTVDGLPIQPNSGDIIIQWSDGASKIFAL